MAPEYGATVGYFPVDAETLNYLRFTGRDEALVQLVEAYCKAQGLFRTDATPEPVFTDMLELDLRDVVPSIAGPRRPQDRVPLTDVEEVLAHEPAVAARHRRPLDRDAPRRLAQRGRQRRPPGDHASPSATRSATPSSRVTSTTSFVLGHGAVVIAAITSCTNTSNPQVLMAAGLLARNAVAARPQDASPG